MPFEAMVGTNIMKYTSLSEEPGDLAMVSKMPNNKINTYLSFN